LIGGAVGMPLVLTAAALTTLRLKYLLPLPADAVFFGTLVGVGIARRRGWGWEAWGWLLITASMTVGLLMGASAFDGPFRPPAALGGYGDFPRRLARLEHSHVIVLGLLCLFVARELEQVHRMTWPGRLGGALLAVGICATVGALPLVAAKALPVGWLGVGPALVATGLTLCTVVFCRGSEDEDLPALADDWHRRGQDQDQVMA
jgi:hypothetical protein